MELDETTMAVIGILAGILILSGWVPQIIKGYRTKKLDDIPSPYLTGLLDKFFDGKLTPMIQTNRGCPFTCTFCVDGADDVNRVNQFGLDRVGSELDYIGKHATKNVHSLHISDLNFGMYPRDLDICDSIVDGQKKYDYPHRIISTTGKNKKERIIKAIEKLKNEFENLQVFSNFSGNPTGKNVTEGVSLYKEKNCDGVIAFGGGSALDVGKGIAFMCGQKRPIWDLSLIHI